MKKTLSRRESLKLGASLGATAFALPFLDVQNEAHAFTTKSHIKISESDGGEDWVEVHKGKGTTLATRFPFDGGAKPANFLTYDFPPGASEGVHTHNIGDEEMGSYDEFYYVVSGSGQMEIDGEIVHVKEGDHVFTPNGVAHGIENTSKTNHLKVFLTYIER